MNDLTSKQSKQLDFLLADYNAIKAEISRRSNLQRIALAAYISLIAFVFKEAPSQLLSSLHIAAMWFGAAITMNYFVRQGKEINRLGEIISEQIAPVVSSITDTKPKDSLPSETNPKNETYDKITSTYNYQFKWLLFFIVPLLITLIYLGQDWNKLTRIVEFNSKKPYVAAISLFFCIWTFILLCKHVNEKSHKPIHLTFSRRSALGKSR